MFFDSKIQPCQNEAKLSAFVSLCRLGQNLQYEARSYLEHSSYEQNSKQNGVENYDRKVLIYSNRTVNTYKVF